MTPAPQSDSASGADAKPYAAISVDIVPTGSERLFVPATIVIVCCVIWLGLLLVTLIAALPFGHPNAPPLIQVLWPFALFAVLPALGVAGAWSTLQRKNHALALISAISLMIPLFGPCFGLTLPLGIWLLLILRRPDVQRSFVVARKSEGNAIGTVDEVLSAASRLDNNGEWDAAIMLYRAALERWPEQASYIERCISVIEKKQSAAAGR